MARGLRQGWVVWLGAALLCAAARAQEPKAGDFHTDDTDLGFKVRVPAKWELIPASPDDGNLIAKYDPKGGKSILVKVNPPTVMDIHCWLIKFDRRKSGASDGDAPKGGRRKFVEVHDNLEKWLPYNVGKGFQVDTQKELEVNKVPATRFVFVSKSDPDAPIRAYAMLYKLQPDVDVALVFNGPGDPKKWDKWDNAFEEMAKSFKPVEIKASKVAAPLAEGATLRDRKRAEIQKQLQSAPGWKLYETPHYFIVSNKDDKALITEMMDRLEAIHEVYEQDYPPAMAAELRAAAAAAKTGDHPGAAPKKPEGEGGEEAPPADPAAESVERSRCSVVRFCATEEQYHSYGGPGSSAGYFSPNSEELVLYVDKVGGIRGTWAVLNHEAFHQYIFYFYGSLSPHSWYNEGTGDFYSGLEYKNKRFTLKKFDWRVSTIKESIQEDEKLLADPKKAGERAIVPLVEIVKMTQAEYYGNNKYELDGGKNYAQGWSLIYFLRTGKKANARGWDPRWDSILDTYLRVLASSGKLDQAVEEAFQGVDFDALEAAWKDYTK